MDRERLFDILPLVGKPSRYIGSEVNAILKDPSSARLRFALCFPDTYEVGISHLGLKILYEVLNRMDGVYAERAYAPWPDMERELAAEGLPLATIETTTPLREMDVVGFTLQYELSYTNVLNMLSLAGIPLRSAERGPSDPIVIAGGPCAFNPEPLANFIDSFVIGDAEEAVAEIAATVMEHKDSGGGRDELLARLSRLEGVYVPAHFEIDRGPDGRISSIRNIAGGPDRVAKRTLSALDKAAYPERPIVPYTAAVHNRVTLEVARGCARGCRFCQAGYIYRPYRARTPGEVVRLADSSIAATGYDELSLSSLSTGDYPQLLPLMSCLMDRFETARVSVSLPSLRVGTLTPEVCEQVRRVRKTGFTVAPEAGSQRLRDVINKNVTGQQLVDTAQTVFREGWDLIKLYFMIGLPTETDEDVEGIIRLSRAVLDAGRRAGGRRKKVNVGVSAFVPKPHTPFQWTGQIPLDEIKRKRETLYRVLGKKPFALKTGLPEMSVLEAALARGGREAGDSIEKAWQKGARFDGWTEMFDFGLWQDAYRAAGLDPEREASRSYGMDELLPWDHIDSGVTRGFLMAEYERAMAGEPTPDCRTECAGCGLDCPDEPAPAEFSCPVAVPARVAAPAGPPARVRIRYSKLRPLSLLSHTEMMNLFFRAISRAGLPIRFSEGFNPHPKVSFGPALAVGIESEVEVLDMELGYAIDLASVVKALNSALPAGVRVLEARVLVPGEPPAGAGVSCHTFEAYAPEGIGAGIDSLATSFMERGSVLVTRPGERADLELDIRPMFRELSALDGGRLRFTLCEHAGRSAKPFEAVAALFGITPEAARTVRLRRVGMS